MAPAHQVNSDNVVDAVPPSWDSVCQWGRWALQTDNWTLTFGYSTGKNKRWNQTRVATARRNYSIAGQKHALPDPETVSLNEAARICGVSHRTIERLVEAGLLKREQVTARAPWRIRRTDLNDESVRSVIERLLRTGKLVLQGGSLENQPILFTEKEGDDNARHHE